MWANVIKLKANHKPEEKRTGREIGLTPVDTGDKGVQTGGIPRAIVGRAGISQPDFRIKPGVGAEVQQVLATYVQAGFPDTAVFR
jgi:hypothetical protein